MISDYIILTDKECNGVVPDGFEEITVREFLTRENASEQEEKDFINTYFAVNIHSMLSVETMPLVYETLNDIKTDKRLKKLNAIVFLSLKRKGRGENFHSISQEEFSSLVRKCRELGINFGFDSCSCHKFLNTIKGTEMEGQSIYAEPCESSCMSAYINARGRYFPCSFTEGTRGWEEGLDVLNCKDFVEDIWYNPKTHNFREILLMNDRNCPIYNV